MITNYIKISSQKPSIYLERAGFDAESASRQHEEFWFFDDADPVAVQAASQKANSYRDRHLGQRLQVCCWRRCAGLERLAIVGEPTPGMLRNWRAA